MVRVAMAMLTRPGRRWPLCDCSAPSRELRAIESLERHTMLASVMGDARSLPMLTCLPNRQDAAKTLKPSGGGKPPDGIASGFPSGLRRAGHRRACQVIELSSEIIMAHLVAHPWTIATVLARC